MPQGKANEARAYGGPGRYLQGPGEIKKLHKTAGIYGKTAMAIIDPFFIDKFSAMLKDQFESNGLQLHTVAFGGECSKPELKRLTEFIASLSPSPDVYIGLGGGKTCDITKAVAATHDKAMIIVPTAISTDAPTSTHSVMYEPDGSYFLMVHKKNPEFVVVDTDIVINAPLHMFVSGLGDALATYIESRASYANNNVNSVLGGGYRPTMAGLALARLSFDILLSKGRDAYLAAKNHIRTQAFEDVAEANTLLSGLGFENTGCSIAHGLQSAFHSVPMKPWLHGAGVGYGALVQLIVENRDHAEFEEIFSWCKDVGIPVCTSDLGIEGDLKKQIDVMVAYAIEAKWLMKNEPITVTKEMVVNAILYLDAYAAQRK
ncbi:MAG: glycerol dehydrogenase [Christensenellales bacterium]